MVVAEQLCDYTGACASHHTSETTRTKGLKTSLEFSNHRVKGIKPQASVAAGSAMVLHPGSAHRSPSKDQFLDPSSQFSPCGLTWLLLGTGLKLLAKTSQFPNQID